VDSSTLESQKGAVFGHFFFRLLLAILLAAHASATISAPDACQNMCVLGYSPFEIFKGNDGTFRVTCVRFVKFNGRQLTSCRS